MSSDSVVFLSLGIFDIYAATLGHVCQRERPDVKKGLNILIINKGKPHEILVRSFFIELACGVTSTDVIYVRSPLL